MTSKALAASVVLMSFSFTLTVAGHQRAARPGSNAAAESSGEVHGTVLDVTGAIVPHASVRLFSLDQFRETATNDEGTFTFVDLPFADYELQADSPGFDTGIRNLKLASQSIGPVSITITSPGVPFHCGWRRPASYETRKVPRVGLAGAVIDSDEGPLRRAKVIVSKLGHTDAMSKQVTDETGHFQFTDLPPGKYTITVSKFGYRGLEGEAFWITRGTLTNITLDTVTSHKLIICQ